MTTKSSPPKPKADKSGDAMLEPYASNLSESPEAQGLAGPDLALESMRFLTHRMNAYAAYFDKLAKCRNFTDVSTLQTTFLTDMQRDYANELANVAAAATLTALPNFARIDTPLAWPPLAAERPRQPSLH